MKHLRLLAASLIVVVFFAFVITDAHALTIFTDGLESGNFNAWTGTQGTIAVNNTVSHHGNYSARPQFAAGVGDAYKSGWSQGTTYLRAYFKFEALLPDGSFARERLLALWADGTILSSIALEDNGTENNWRLGYYDGGAYFATYYNVPPNLDTWYYVELFTNISTTTGAAIGWVNGTEAFSATSIDTGNTNMSELRVGKSVGDASMGYFFDCVNASTTYVGAEPVPTVIVVGDEIAYFLLGAGVGSFMLMPLLMKRRRKERI